MFDKRRNTMQLSRQVSRVHQPQSYVHQLNDVYRVEVESVKNNKFHRYVVFIHQHLAHLTRAVWSWHSETALTCPCHGVTSKTRRHKSALHNRYDTSSISTSEACTYSRLPLRQLSCAVQTLSSLSVPKKSSVISILFFFNLPRK